MQPLFSSSLSAPLLSCSRLSLRRGQRQILDGLNLDLESGTLTALLGPNGAGKSSLLKCLTGELEYEGSITLFGADRQQWDSGQLAHRLGVLPQSSSLNFPFLCEEVVAMGRLPHSEPAARRDEIVAAAMTHAGVEHLAKRLYPGLSGGERQRVHIARALAQSPSEILLDEPTNHLDIHHQMQLMQLISELPVTSIVAIHDLNHAAMFCDSLIVMQQGQILASGTPEEILSEALLWDVFRVKTKIEISPYHGKKHIHFIV